MRKVILLSFVFTGLFASAQKKPDFLAANIDHSVAPGTDFFLYANGGWINKTPIPSSESGWGIGNLVQEEIYSRIKAINYSAAQSTQTHGSTSQKIGDFWKAAMDTVAINKAGLSVLKTTFKTIDAITSPADLTAVAAGLHIAGVNCFFSQYVAQDDKNSDAMVYRLDQGGLGLPNREYYFKTDERTAKVREAYKNYVTLTLQQLGMNKAVAEKSMKEIFELETRLAIASRKLEDLRDPYANYNKMTFGSLAADCPAINWNKYATAVGIKANIIADSIVIGQPEFYKALSHEIQSTSIAVWKNYLKFHVIQSAAGFLDNTTYMNAFNYRRALTGAKEPRPRWKRVLDAEEGAMGELLGQLFAKEYFNEKAKARYSNLVEAIREAYVDRIKKLSWMSAETKTKALDKLSKVSEKVGYPDKWKDFSSLNIIPGSYFKNMMAASTFWHFYSMNKLGKPVDRTEWDMTPQTYNAYYNPSNNEIVLPAGIFAVPGMKDDELDDAFVYGYAGASTIGHEITHGFDDQGRQYDAKGNLTDWWTTADGEEFKTRAKAIINQFNEFMPVDTLHINGEATQGENIADLGGMLLGLDAYKKTKEYKEGKLIGGLTPIQRYFLGYAYGWMYQEKKERLANQVMTDVHAPAKERVNGPVVNIAEFYEAFGIKPGDKMYRADNLRVTIW
ncbi:M13 family metallopeptidase [Ferruginibacter sp. SUN106]|uniref:M13 family metallopeptidase n=1 Tax=Ferruginibacter sp. SUN106 TaxID=2978348 RepID=UPI003D365FC9